MVADPALRRPARDVVRDAPTGEDTHGAVVHRRRNRDLDRLLALAQDADEVVLDPECIGDLLELLLCEPERVLSQVALTLHERRHRSYCIEKETCSLLGAPPFVGQATRRSW